MMGMRMSLSPRLKLKPRFSLSQKLGLKQLLTIGQELRHPDIPNPTLGLEGMKVANEMLKNRGSRGVLIGGISEKIWNRRTKKEELYNCKDVDVLVPDYNFDVKDFEGGIDWWLPESERISVRNLSGADEERNVEWYRNGNGAVLSFGVKTDLSYYKREGLYILDREWVINMREAEVRANIDYGRIGAEIDEEVFDKFREIVGKRVKTRLPKFITDSFRGQILSDYYDNFFDRYSFPLFELDLNEIRGIYRELGKSQSVYNPLSPNATNS